VRSLRSLVRSLRSLVRSLRSLVRSPLNGSIVRRPEELEMEEPDGTLDASDELMELVFFAMDYGIDNVRGGGRLVPFLVTVDEGGRTLHRLALPRLEEAVERGREMITELDGKTLRYALTYDGYFTRPGGERLDAIFVQAADRGSGAYLFAQQYRPKRFLRSLQVLGNMAFAGKVAPGGENAV
jgi:hypothetical protein